MDTVFLCLDNDHAGQRACERMADELQELGMTIERIVPTLKDWNEDLVAQANTQEPVSLTMG